MAVEKIGVVDAIQLLPVNEGWGRIAEGGAAAAP